MPEQAAKVGILTEEGPSLDKSFSADKAPPFAAVRLAAPRGETFHRITFPAPGQTGWLVVTEAFHPDWLAKNGSEITPTLPANGALLAAEIRQPDEPIVFQFSPPWWYTVFPLVAMGGWAALAALLLLQPVLPARVREALNAVPKLQRAPRAELGTIARPDIAKPVVVIPTYNEIQSLPRTLEKVFTAHPFVEVLVVDDGSPDGTGDWVRQHPEFGRRVHLLARRGKLGLGSAYREGFAWSFERGYDACLEMDADLSHDPADIPRLLEALDAGADAAIGSRYLGGVRVMNWPEGRLFLSTGASKFVRLVTGMPLTDATSGFKALRVAVLRQLDWSRFRTEGYGFQVELHHTLWQAGARLVEVPIVFTERRDGQTKMTIGIAIEAAVHTVRLAFEK
jgi:dolichol-phosphate mannosyltransferase